MRPIWSPTVSGSVPPALAPGPDPALAPGARVLGDALLRRRGHRAERVVDQVRRVLEDRELGAVVEQLAHRRSLPESERARAVTSRGTCPRDCPWTIALRGRFRRRAARLASTDAARSRARDLPSPPGTTSSAAASSSGRSSWTTSTARPGSSCSLDVERRFGWKIHVWILLDNHFHLLVETTQPELSRGMQRLNGLHAMRFNRRYDRVGHLFQGRFESRVIEDDELPRRPSCSYIYENSDTRRARAAGRGAACGSPAAHPPLAIGLCSPASAHERREQTQRASGWGDRAPERRCGRPPGRRARSLQRPRGPRGAPRGLREQPERLVVDLGEVDFVDSTALGVLIEARTKLENRTVVPARRARARDPPRPHDLRPRPAPLRARHGRVGARGLAQPPDARRALGHRTRCSRASALGAGTAHRRGTTANGIPAYVDGYAKWPKAEPRPDPRRLVRAPGNQERLREQAQDRRPLSGRDDRRQDRRCRPGRRWLSLVATMRKDQGDDERRLALGGVHALVVDGAVHEGRLPGVGLRRLPLAGQVERLRLHAR